MKKVQIIIILILLNFLFQFVGCITNPSEHEDKRKKTLASLKKVDDFPLYVMHFYDDYNLNVSVPGKSILNNKSDLNNSNSKVRWACTCFSTLNGGSDIILGRNFDWYDHPALLIFTHPEGAYTSVSMVDISYLGYAKNDPVLEDPNALLGAPLLPFDGMNEHGLAIGMMALSNAEPPRDSGKETAGSLLAIRLMLDYAKNVDEAIAILHQYNIDFTGGPPLHYFITDKSKKSAIIEFVNNEIKILHSDYKWQVATNFIISGLSNKEALASCWRYKTAWETFQRKNGILSQEEMMLLLKNVSQAETIWSILYNTTTLDIHVVMGKKYKQEHYFKLN